MCHLLLFLIDTKGLDRTNTKNPRHPKQTQLQNRCHRQRAAFVYRTVRGSNMQWCQCTNLILHTGVQIVCHISTDFQCHTCILLTQIRIGAALEERAFPTTSPWREARMRRKRKRRGGSDPLQFPTFCQPQHKIRCQCLSNVSIGLIHDVLLFTMVKKSKWVR